MSVWNTEKYNNSTVKAGRDFLTSMAHSLYKLYLKLKSEQKAFQYIMSYTRLLILKWNQNATFGFKYVAAQTPLFSLGYSINK